MNWSTFREIFRDETYVSTDWIHTAVPDFDKRRLYEWKKKWYLIQLKRKRYMFADVQMHHTLQLHLASVIYKPSYISLFTALARYQLIPETVITTQCISSRKTAEFHTEYGSWSYRSCQPHYLWWYDVIHSRDGVLVMADIHKTLLDLLTYYPEYDDVDDFASLRLDYTLLTELMDIHTLRDYAQISSSSSVQHRVQRFCDRINLQWDM